MTRRIDDFVAIRNGELLLPNISIIESRAIKDMFDVLDTNAVTFYGITETPSVDSPFYCLFSNDIETLRFHLVNENDICKNAWNCDRSTWMQTWLPKSTGIEESPRFSNLLWNNLTMLEVAQLLENKDAVELLLTFQRRTWWYKNSRNTSYKGAGMCLAKRFGKADIVDRLKKFSFLPSVWSLKGMKE